jgi:hypothetical protein
MSKKVLKEWKNERKCWKDENPVSQKWISIKFVQKRKVSNSCSKKPNRNQYREAGDARVWKQFGVGEIRLFTDFFSELVQILMLKRTVFANLGINSVKFDTKPDL